MGANPGYGFYGHHVYHGPPCKPAFVEETKEVCHIEPEKVCETKTRTYKVVTGYEDESARRSRCASSPTTRGEGPPSPSRTTASSSSSVRRRQRRFARRSPSSRRSRRTSSSATSSRRRCARRRPSRSPPCTARSRGRTSANVERNVIRVCHFENCHPIKSTVQL